MGLKGDLMSKTKTSTIFAFFLFTILFALLSACGGSDKNSDSSGSSDKEGPTSAPTATAPSDPVGGASYNLAIVCNEAGEVVSITGEGLEPDPQTHTCKASGAEEFSLSLKQEVNISSPNNLTLSSKDEHGNLAGSTTTVDVPIDTIAPTVSIDDTSLPNIDASNAQSFTVEGTCSEEGEPVMVSVGGVSPETDPDCGTGGSWSVILDVTSLNKTSGAISITANHLSPSGTNAIQASESVTNNFICPANFVGVPSLTGYTTNSFCVMKYEAKNDGSDNAISQAASTPWVSINRSDSITKCQAMGAAGYDLITNDEWQSIARNIELVGSNWANGAVGDAGGLNTGHSDDSPSNTLPANSDDNNACHATGQSCNSNTWHSQKRTHTLSNGEVVWDMAGNVLEYIKDKKDNTFYGVLSYVSQITDDTHSTSGSLSEGITATSRTAKGHFGPSGNYTTLNSNPYGGLGYNDLTALAITMIRGGRYTQVDLSGLFYIANGGGHPSTTGFRCVYRP